jgi:hypothetical protein
MDTKSDEIAELLKKLQVAGAEVKDNAGNKITDKILSSIGDGNTQDFNAWVSWTKSF